MSFFPRQNPRSARPPWESFATVEDFSHALMMAGADTDEARELLRAARSHFNRIDQAREQAARRREALEHRRELSRETAAMSAAKLRRETGYAEDEDPIAMYATGSTGSSYTGHCEWLGRDWRAGWGL